MVLKKGVGLLECMLFLFYYTDLQLLYIILTVFEFCFLWYIMTLKGVGIFFKFGFSDFFSIYTLFQTDGGHFIFLSFSL